MAAAAPPAPFACADDGGLRCEAAPLTEIAAGLEGGAAWVLSRAALVAALDDPRTLPVSAVGPPAVLALAAEAGWWAGVTSPHELELATAAGFPAERLVAGGAVVDDGFLKDALVAGVAVLTSRDEEEARNVARIAEHLALPVPAAEGAPPAADASLFDRCGGLLAPVLRGPPALVLDGVLAPATGLEAWTLASPHDPAPARVEGLGVSPVDGPGELTLHGAPRRGDHVLVPHPAAARLRPHDPAWPEAVTVLVNERLWRFLEPRPWPEADEGPGG